MYESGILFIGGLKAFSTAGSVEDFLSLFAPDDLVVDEDDQYAYETVAWKAKERLDIIGFTGQRARDFFEACHPTIESYETWKDYIRYAVENELDSFNIDEESTPAKDWDREKYPELPEILRNPEDWEEYGDEILGYPTSESEDIRLCFRALLDCVEDETEVTLEYNTETALGYYLEDPDLFAAQAESNSASSEISERTIILTEGSTDAHILKSTLEFRYPHVSHLYGFLDFSESRMAGGASELVKLIKAFVGCRITGRYLAIFDADTAATEAIAGLAKIGLPSNIKVLQLPTLELASNYPTIGPQGDVCMDVNGMAASLELYLGCTALIENDEYTKIQWMGYSDKLKKYQGELIGKDNIRKNFLALLKNDPESIDWSGIDAIWKAIFVAFH
jgi:hypothetical protein